MSVSPQDRPDEAEEETRRSPASRTRTPWRLPEGSVRLQDGEEQLKPDQ